MPLNSTQLDPRLVDTLMRVFDLDPASITSDMSPRTIPAWDSVGHINLVLELEEVFGVRFSSDEIPELNTVGRLQEAVARRTVKPAATGD